MSKIKSLLIALGAMVPSLSFAYGVGYASYPLQEKKLLLSPEFMGILSEGSGAGIQGRVTFKPNQPFMVDGGFGAGTGEHSIRLFAGADYEIFPDYEKQPRISVKANWEHAREFKQSVNIIGITPTVSKGFNFWGHDAYPYIAVPLALGLHDKTKTYHSRINLALGMSGKIPEQIQGNQGWVGNIETTFSLKDSYGGFLLSLGYPLN